MILFITNYDDATKANFSVGMSLTYAGQQNLFSECAIRNSLISTIDTNSTHLFIMSHGTPTNIQGNDGQAALGLCDIGLLSSRKTYAWACHTAAQLGQCIAQQGGTWHGYNNVISAPSEQALIRQYFIEIFQYIIDNFSSVETNEQAINFINEIKRLCDDAANEIANIADNNTPIQNELFQSQSCCRQIWNLLRIWLPNRELPVYHPDIIGDILGPAIW